MKQLNDLPVIVLPRLEGNPPAQLTWIQESLWPYLWLAEAVWASIWCAVLGYLIIRFIVLPLRGERSAAPGTSAVAASLQIASGGGASR